MSLKEYKESIEQNILNVTGDNFNLLYSDEDELEDIFNRAYNEWRISVKWFKDIDVIFIHTSYSWCDNVDKVCQVLGIKSNERDCIVKVDNLDEKWKMYPKVQYIVNVALLRKMRVLDKM